MQKCEPSPNNEPKLRPDCMIIEITNEELTGLSRTEIEMETLMFPPRQMADPGIFGAPSWDTPLTPGT
jgi:hypothetical protein